MVGGRHTTASIDATANVSTSHGTTYITPSTTTAPFSQFLNPLNARATSPACDAADGMIEPSNGTSCAERARSRAGAELMASLCARAGLAGGLHHEVERPLG